MSGDNTRMVDSAGLGASFLASDYPGWYCVTHLKETYIGDDPVTGNTKGTVIDHAPIVGNLLMNGGASIIWERLTVIAASTSSTGALLQAYSTGNALIGVSTSNTAASVTQVDLQGSTKFYGSMESGYPSHTDGTAATTAREVQFRMIASTSEANHAWNEWAIMNRSTGRMLNRKVQSLGTKTSAAQWTLTVTLGLS